MTQPCVLIVDDEPALRKLLDVNLRRDYQVITARDGDESVDVVAREQPDLIILDLMLGDGPDGYEVCRRIRQFSDVPVIILTAKVQENDKLRGFSVGADDYVTKPFSVNELLARIKAILKRKPSDRTLDGQVIHIDRLVVDLVRRRVTVHDVPVELTPTEYKLLTYLATNMGRVVLHSELLTHVWGPEYRGEVEYLRVYISRLRQKLNDGGGDRRLLHTQPGIGYLLAADGD